MDIKIIGRRLSGYLRRSQECQPKGAPEEEGPPVHSGDAIVLDEGARFEVAGPAVGLARWMPIQHCSEQRHSIILRAGDELTFSDELSVGKDFSLYIRYAAGLPEISADGLVCEIIVGMRGHEYETILALPVSGGKQDGEWRVAQLDLGWLAGSSISVGMRCMPGPQNDPSADWLAVSEFCIARKNKLALTQARSFAEIRIKNEIEHFSNVYKHEMYTNVQGRLAENVKAGGSEIARTVRRVTWRDRPEAVDTPQLELLADIAPVQDESPYDYASRLLGRQIAQRPPNFAARLKSRTANGPVRVLSLCSGAARIEAGFAAQVGDLAEWTLLDINSDLLRMAAQQFPRSVKVDLIEANVNELSNFGEKWDIILCVSALHHIVELERLFGFCHASLSEGGEFWSIGENIGRNGNRLWPDAMDAANTFFSQLPERLRLNRHTGTVDHTIPDKDYSAGCFEGIRSEDIESTLDTWFQQDHIYRLNCFLWRIINLAYSDNYALKNPEDRMWIHKAVQAECTCFRNGGRGTELHGVYRPRMI